jgi:hypothetical protein
MSVIQSNPAQFLAAFSTFERKASALADHLATTAEEEPAWLARADSLQVDLQAAAANCRAAYHALAESERAAVRAHLRSLPGRRLEFRMRRDARVERLQDRAARLKAEGNARLARADDMASIIPLGQPILVAHHSEGRDRRYRARIHNNMDKAFAALKAADQVASRAAAAEENRAVFSDDPDAIGKLTREVEELERRQELDKKVNKLVRKNDRAGLAAMGFKETTIANLFEPDFCGRIGIPGYVLTNRGANIRRIKARIQELGRTLFEETTEQEIGQIRIVDNVEENRLQIFFPGKPAEAVRGELKSAGFRWSPSIGCWQRHRSSQATWRAERIAGKCGTESATAAG